MRLIYFFIFLLVCASCKKDDLIIEDIPIIDDPIEEAVNEIIDTLISGSTCTSFSRLFQGSAKEDFWAGTQTLDGGYIFCGSTNTFTGSGTQLLTIKTDCFGEIEWMDTISGDYSHPGRDIIPLSSGEYIIAGITEASFNNLRGTLTKISDTGSFAWSNTYDLGSSHMFHKVLETSDGGFIISGTDQSSGSFLLKTDEFGTETWQKQIPIYTHIYDIAINSNQNYVACGSTNGNPMEDIFIAEYDLNGDTLWTNSIDKAGIQNFATSIVELNSNEYALAGYDRVSGTEMPGFAMKFDAVGNEIWYNSLQSNGVDNFDHIVATSDNHILGIGVKSNVLSILKLDLADGSIIWESVKQDGALIRDLDNCTDGGYIISGRLPIVTGNTDGYILKVDANGQ